MVGLGAGFKNIIPWSLALRDAIEYQVFDLCRLFELKRA